MENRMIPLNIIIFYYIIYFDQTFTILCRYNYNYRENKKIKGNGKVFGG